MLPLDASHYLRNLFRNIIHLEIYYIFINTPKQYKFEISRKNLPIQLKFFIYISIIINILINEYIKSVNYMITVKE